MLMHVLLPKPSVVAERQYEAAQRAAEAAANATAAAAAADEVVETPASADESVADEPLVVPASEAVEVPEDVVDGADDGDADASSGLEIFEEEE